jgi:GT2 family glycosyltransferase
VAGPRVTVSLVTYNGVRWLDGCLASLRAQTLDDYELIVRDNASTDGTVELLRSRLADDTRARIVESPRNLGYAAAHNLAVHAARSEFVLLLNQDVELDGGFLAAALETLDERPAVAAIQGRIRRLEPGGTRADVLDTTGLEMRRDRRFVSRSQGRLDGTVHDQAGSVFGADGPAPVYRTAALRDARLPRTGGGWEVLDEDFFMYKEDVDLAWRLRRLGWDAWYEPRAAAWHGRGAAGPPGDGLLAIARSNRLIPRWIKQVSWRNQRLMQLKNESLSDYLRDLPWIARREVLSLGFILVADPRRLSVVPGLIRLLPSAARKRRYLWRRIRARRAT